MSEYLITLSGCDDSTRAVIELTDREHEVMQRVAEAVNARSRYGCQPEIEIKPVDQMNDYERECIAKPDEEN